VHPGGGRQAGGLANFLPFLCQFKLATMYKAIVLFTSCLCASGAGAQQLSDLELKREVVPLEQAVEYLRQLEPKAYEYDTETFGHLDLPEGKRHGFIAEDLERVLPQSVAMKHRSYTAGKNNYRTASHKEVDLESLIPLLVAAIQEQQAQIENLKKQAEASSVPASGTSRTSGTGAAPGSPGTCSSCGGSCG